jgi:hypothetical protein
MIDMNDPATDRKLTSLVYTVLDAFAANEIDRENAMAGLAHVIAAAIRGNAGMVRRWLEPEAVQTWLDTVRVCPTCRQRRCTLGGVFGV